MVRAVPTAQPRSSGFTFEACTCCISWHHNHLQADTVLKQTTTAMSAKLVTNVDERALKKTKFPPEFSHKVDVQKINLPVIQKWISDELAKILNTEDDVLTTTVCNYLEESRYVGARYLEGGLVE